MRIQQRFNKSLLGAFLHVFGCLWILVIIKPGCLFARCGCKREKASDSFLLLPFIFPVPIQIHFFCVFLFFQLSSVFRNTTKMKSNLFLKNKNKSATTFSEHLEQAVTLYMHLWSIGQNCFYLDMLWKMFSTCISCQSKSI